MNFQTKHKLNLNHSTYKHRFVSLHLGMIILTISDTKTSRSRKGIGGENEEHIG